MIKEIPLSKLRLLEKNPRRITKEQLEKLKQSLQDDPEFLHKRPVLVNVVDGKHIVYASNQRVSAARKLGWKTIPCDVDENIDEKLMRSRVIKDNKTFGEFDFEILANEWEIPELIEYGFTPDELSIDVDVVEGDGEEESELPDPSKDEDSLSKPGDVYELQVGRLVHRVVCGDSTDPDVVSKALNGEEPVLMVTDPPYGVDYSPQWRTSWGGNLKLGKVLNDNQWSWFLAYRHFPGSVAYVWCASIYLVGVYEDLKNCDLEVKSLIIWAKQHFAISRGDYHWKHEACWYAVKKGHLHNWQGSRKESTVWEIDNLCSRGKSQDEDERTAHSTQKPLECMSRPIKNNTAKGEGVYDPFLGSGTTLIAAQQTGRVCYGIELSTGYCDLIIQRFVNYMTKNNLLFSIKKNGEEINWDTVNEAPPRLK